MKMILCSLVFFTFVTGCGNQAPLVKVYALRQTYTATLNGLTTAIESGLVRDKATLREIRDAIRPEIESDLNDAEAKAVAGDKIGATFVLDHVESLLEKLLVVKSKALGPATRPASHTENPQWTPQRSSLSSSVEPKSFKDLVRLSPRFNLAELSPMTKWLSSSPNKPLPNNATTMR